MGLKSIQVMGADDYATNVSGTNYAAAAQLTAKPTKVFSLTVSVYGNASGDRFIYLFDTAAGSAASVGPKIKFGVFKGGTGTLDFGGNGCVFKKGVYMVVATNEVPDANTAPTAGSNNDAMVDAEFRLIA